MKVKLISAFFLGVILTLATISIHPPQTVKAATPKPFLIDPPTWCMVTNTTVTPMTLDLYEDDSVQLDSNKHLVSTGKSLSTTLTALGDAAYQGKP